MRVEFERLWLVTSKRSEIQLTLDQYDQALGRYDNALAWLRSGQRDPATYQASKAPIVWQQGFQDLETLVQMVGFENLPPTVQGWLGGKPAKE
jgi:hypothetical protein